MSFEDAHKQALAMGYWLHCERDHDWDELQVWLDAYDQGGDRKDEAGFLMAESGYLLSQVGVLSDLTGFCQCMGCGYQTGVKRWPVSSYHGPHIRYYKRLCEVCSGLGWMFKALKPNYYQWLGKKHGIHLKQWPEPFNSRRRDDWLCVGPWYPTDAEIEKHEPSSDPEVIKSAWRKMLDIGSRFDDYGQLDASRPLNEPGLTIVSKAMLAASKEIRKATKPHQAIGRNIRTMSAGLAARYREGDE